MFFVAPLDLRMMMVSADPLWVRKACGVVVGPPPWSLPLGLQKGKTACGDGPSLDLPPWQHLRREEDTKTSRKD